MLVNDRETPGQGHRDWEIRLPFSGKRESRDRSQWLIEILKNVRTPLDAAIECYSTRYASAEMSLIVHYLFLQVVFLHPSWSKEDSAILTASCNTPTPDIQSFCQQNQPQNQADCQIFLIRAIQRRCTTWLDSDHVKIPVSFEADPVTSCALPMTVDNKPVCVLTKERAVRMNRSNIQQFGRFTLKSIRTSL